MTNAFKSIKEGLTEALAHAKTKDTETTGVKLYQPHAVNVADLRQRLRLTQEQFAARFGFQSPRCVIGSVATAPQVVHRWYCST